MVVCARSIESRLILEHGKGEFLQNVPAIVVIKRALHLEVQAPEKFSPVCIAVVGSPINHKSPALVVIPL